MADSWAVRLFDTTAMTSYPLIARLLGYTFQVGRSDALRQDARAVLREVWSKLGVSPPATLAQIGERYERASTWIVAYHQGRPVGAKALLDVRVASIALDVMQRRLPP